MFSDAYKNSALFHYEQPSGPCALDGSILGTVWNGLVLAKEDKLESLVVGKNEKR